MNLSKERIILGAVVIAIVFSIIVTMYGQLLSTQPHWLQFVLVSLIGYLLPSLVIGITRETDPLMDTIGAICLIGAFDLLAPPLSIGLDGTINVAGLFGGGSIDVFLAEFYAGSLGITGLPAFILVYPVSFVLLITIAIFLLSKKNFVEIALKGAAS